MKVERRLEKLKHLCLFISMSCRVVVLRCRSTSHLTCPILSHQVIYNHQVLQIQVSYIQTYIHTFMRIQHAHKYHSYIIALTTLSLAFNHILEVSSPGLLDYKMSLKFLFLKSVIPRLSEDGLLRISFHALSEEGMSRRSFPALSEDRMSSTLFLALSEDGMQENSIRFNIGPVDISPVM